MEERKLISVLLCITLGYLIGGFSPSFMIGKVKGFDIRQEGSHNAGASNTLLMAGKAAGILVALLDIFKATFSWWLCRWLFPGVKLASILGGVSCILGHMFPPFLGFRGGKGLACMGGVILAYNFKTFLLMLSIAILIGLATNYLCIVTNSMAAIWPVYFGATTGNWLGAVVLLIPLLPIVLKHGENFRRIPEGKELRLSYLWNKEEELLRIGHDESGGQ